MNDADKDAIWILISVISVLALIFHLSSFLINIKQRCRQEMILGIRGISHHKVAIISKAIFILTCFSSCAKTFGLNINIFCVIDLIRFIWHLLSGTSLPYKRTMQ